MQDGDAALGGGVEHAPVAADVEDHGGSVRQDPVQQGHQGLLQQHVRTTAQDPAPRRDLTLPGQAPHGLRNGRVVRRTAPVRLELAHGPADDVAVGVQKSGHQAGAGQIHLLRLAALVQQPGTGPHRRHPAVPDQQGLLRSEVLHGADRAVVVKSIHRPYLPGQFFLGYP